MKLSLSLTAAALTLSMVTPALAAPMNSVFYFDAQRAAFRGATITESVLDSSIYAEIDRVHPMGLPETANQDLIEAQRGLVLARRKKNREAVQEHCKRERRVSAPNEEAKCGGGFAR